RRNGLTLSQLPDALAQQGEDYAAYREDLRREITLSLLRQRDVLQRISVTPREIDQFLEKQAKTPSERSEYNVSHILIAVAQEASPAQLEQAGKRATDVYQRAKAGEDFAKLAVAYSNSQTALEGGKLLALRERILKGEDFAGLAQTSSEDPGSAADGGDLGWAGPGTFAPEFEQATAGLKDNELSQPFHTQFGWHLVQVLGHRRF